MKEEDFLEKNFKEALEKVAFEKKLEISQEIIKYISQVLALYYKGLPLYLIDISEKTPFRKYKAKGDISLLLVGLFTEWLERKNRPLKEADYIKTGKLSYYNAYMYLNLNFGQVVQEEFEKISAWYSSLTDTLLTYIDVFKEISENFEKYAYLLKEYREENQQLKRLYDTFNQLRYPYLKDFL
jgi:uncharacterized phage infection (PIP) family protein YhgE